MIMAAILAISGVRHLRSTRPFVLILGNEQHGSLAVEECPLLVNEIFRLRYLGEIANERFRPRSHAAPSAHEAAGPIASFRTHIVLARRSGRSSEHEASVN
jgi:hypothetical protein